MNKLIKQAYLLIIGLLAAIALTACSFSASPTLPSKGEGVHSSPPVESQSSPNNEASPTSSEPEAREPVQTEATLIAAGDIMVHMPQLPAYYNKASDSYDLTPWFSLVKPILQQGDWVIGNLEAPIAGKDLKYTGYPRFNAPDELAEAIADAGFQLVSTANNHSMDRGFPGVERTLATVRKTGLIPVGTADSIEDQQRMVIEERNNIRMGFLSYTYGTNGIPVPVDKEFAVNLIDVPTIKSDIERLREAGTDVVTVSLHFGVEYQRMPNEEQKQLARELIEAGADILLGSHPHVVQPYEVLEIPTSESIDGVPRRGVVIYSLGNFISNQTENWKDVGLIFGVKIIKNIDANGNSTVHLDTITTEPTWVHIVRKEQKRHYTIIPMRSAMDEQNLEQLTSQDYNKIKTMLNEIDQHLVKLQQ